MAGRPYFFRFREMSCHHHQRIRLSTVVTVNIPHDGFGRIYRENVSTRCHPSEMSCLGVKTRTRGTSLIGRSNPFLDVLLLKLRFFFG